MMIGICLAVPAALLLAQPAVFRDEGMFFAKAGKITLSRIGYG